MSAPSGNAKRTDRLEQFVTKLAKREKIEMTGGTDTDLDLTTSRVIKAPSFAGLAGLDRPGELRPVVDFRPPPSARSWTWTSVLAVPS